MSRAWAIALLCGLAVGCGDSKPTPPPEDPESVRRAEEDAKKEGQREDAARKKDKRDYSEDD